MSGRQDLSGLRVLVVGGNGFIGRHVVRALDEAGARAVVMDISEHGRELPHLDWVIGSISDKALFASAASGCDTVIFLANSSLPGSSNDDLASEVESHVQSSVKAAEICEEQGVGRFIFSSSGGTVYGIDSDEPITEDTQTKPRNAYGVSKLATEHYLRVLGMLKGMRTMSLRISNPYGEGQRGHRNQGFIAAAIHRALAGKTLPIWGDGTVERDFIHVSDVARAFVAACAAETPPQTVNIGSGKAISLLQLIERIEAVLGCSVPVVFEKGRAIDVKRNVLDITRARETLGWQPEIPLDEGLARTVEWWRQNLRL